MTATFSQINAEIAQQKALKRWQNEQAAREASYRASFRPGQIPTGKGRRAPTDSELLALEARGEPCEDDGCNGVACYGNCCFPPRGYGELHHVYCHDHWHAYFRDDECLTCDRLHAKLREHQSEKHAR